MIIGIPRETVNKFKAQGLAVWIEAGAGLAASLPDGGLALTRPGAVIVGLLDPSDAAGLTGFALEAAPRTTRGFCTGRTHHHTDRWRRYAGGGPDAE